MGGLVVFGALGEFGALGRLWGTLRDARWHARPRNLTPGCAAFLIEKGSLRLPKALNGLTLSGPALAFRKLIKQIERALGESGPAPLQHPPASQAPETREAPEIPTRNPNPPHALHPNPWAGQERCRTPGIWGRPTRVPPGPGRSLPHLRSGAGDAGWLSGREPWRKRRSQMGNANGGWHKSLRSLWGFESPRRAPRSGSCFPFDSVFLLSPKGPLWMAGGESLGGMGRAGGASGPGLHKPPRAWPPAGRWLKVSFPICHYWYRSLLEPMHRWPPSQMPARNKEQLQGTGLG